MSERAARRGRLGWLAAEFVVVVLGVVVGLAVDAWREDQADIELEHGYLERLQADLEADITAFSQASELDSIRAEAVVAFLAIVDGEEPFPDDPLDFPSLMSRALVANFGQGRRGTYDEMINQGDLGRLGESGLRTLLSEYHGDISRMASQLREWEADVSRGETLLIQRLPARTYRWVQAVAGPLGPDRTRAGFDLSGTEVQELLEQIRGDAELKNLFFRISQIQLRLSGTHREWHQDATEILTALDARLASG